MSQKEKISPAFNFPRKINEDLLGELLGGVRESGSLVWTIANRIEEEGLLLRDVVGKVLPQDWEAKIAIDEYTRVGTFILEIEEVWRRGYVRSETVRLLEEDPSGFSLLTWWVNQGSEDFKDLPREERLGALIGRLNGMARYKRLYQALVGSRP